jgi:choline kinase
MRAVLLAAGRGRRLGRDVPKCLLEVGGKTLLERHIRNMAEAGITALTIVVGFHASMIRDALAQITSPFPIELVDNPRFERGSIVSLHTASVRIAEGCIFMDADVLYPAALLGRLVTSKHDNAVLIDTRSEETGEEMMVGVTADRVMAIARKVSPLGTWDLIGESVGFAKVSAAGGKIMTRLLQTEVEAGRLDQEYEAAMNIAFSEITWGYEPVGDVDWTEIDFPEDVVRANEIASRS